MIDEELLIQPPLWPLASVWSTSPSTVWVELGVGLAPIALCWSSWYLCSLPRTHSPSLLLWLGLEEDEALWEERDKNQLVGLCWGLRCEACCRMKQWWLQINGLLNQGTCQNHFYSDSLPGRILHNSFFLDCIRVDWCERLVDDQHLWKNAVWVHRGKSPDEIFLTITMLVPGRQRSPDTDLGQATEG